MGSGQSKLSATSLNGTKLVSHYKWAFRFHILYLILFSIMLLLSGLMYYKETPEGMQNNNVNIDSVVVSTIIMVFIGIGLASTIIRLVYYYVKNQ